MTETVTATLRRVSPNPDAVKTSEKMGRVTVTPVTNFRIPADIKAAAQDKAQREGKTLSRVVIDLLREYARETDTEDQSS